MFRLIRSIAALIMITACTGRIEISQLPSLDGKGLSGLYSAQIGNNLYVAGGCNFPDAPLIEGGKKKFYDDIMMLDGEKWVTVGHLPAPSAYAAYLATGGGLLMMGGANDSGSMDCVWFFDGATVTERPSLPKPLEQAACCGSDGKIYLVGGLSNGEPSRDVLVFGNDEWKTVATLPVPVVQGIAVVEEGCLRVWGGFDPSAKEALKGGYALNLSTGEWSALAVDVTFTGSAQSGCYAAGGCDAEIFTAALNLPKEKIREYQSRPVDYYRFRGELRKYEGGRWKMVAKSAHLARAGAAIAEYQGDIISIGGELKPGVRSSEVWRIKVK